MRIHACSWKLLYNSCSLALDTSWSLDDAPYRNACTDTSNLANRLKGKIHGLYLTDRNIIKHFAWAFRCAAVDLPLNDIIKEVFFEPMPTKALRAGPYSPAVLPLTVPKHHIQPILSGISDLLLELFEFLFVHHLSTIRVSHDASNVKTLFFLNYLTYSR